MVEIIKIVMDWKKENGRRHPFNWRGVKKNSSKPALKNCILYEWPASVER